MRRWGLGLVMVVCLGRTAWAEDAAAGFIRQLGTALPPILAVREAPARRAQLRAFLGRVVAVDRVARFCLGQYWRRTDDGQRARYEGLYLDLLTRNVDDRLARYGGGSRSGIAILPVVRRGDEALVPTVVTGGEPGTPAANVTWVVEVSGEPYRLLDVMAEGMSLRLAQRSDFTGYLDQHGGDIEGFLAALRAHAGG